ncbi:MAG: HAD family hydrolase [Candidatus ainarchaeum sp.]|nr:HAD family hydrolase [Candidatus ainarchaeum sp.]
MVVKLIIFDLWKTLIPATINVANLKTLLKESNISMDEFITRYENAVQKKKYDNFEELRNDFFKEFHEINNENLERELNEIYLNRFDKIKYFPEVRSTLEKLNKNKYSVALLSNAESLHSEEIIEKLKLTKYFDYLGFSFNFGDVKPNKIVFEKILNEFNVNSNEAIMVGDSLESDIMGANNCKIHSCWINRTNKKNETKIKPDFIISSLDEIFEVLEKLKE